MIINGIVVLYNPKIENINNILTYLPFLSKLYIVDNSSENNKNMFDKFKSNKLEYIPLNHNTGIANALNIGMQKIIDSKESVDYCLTMDQDSKFPLDRFDDVKKYLIENMEKKEYGIIGLNFNSISNIKSIKKVRYWLTSGNFILIELYKKIKGFKSELFVDYVDVELNEQFFNQKISIGYIQDISLEHKIGNPIEKNLLFKRIYCMNHNPIRYYYRYRNLLFLYKKNKKFYRKKYLHDNIIDILKIIFFEPMKIKKLKMIRRGKKDARKNILGEYKER